MRIISPEIEKCSKYKLKWFACCIVEISKSQCGSRKMVFCIMQCHYTPIYTKKNRPAYTLTVICKESEREKLENLIFSETTTIGIRRVEMERTILQREIQKKDTPVGTAIVKACTLPDGNIRYYPEYENVAELAERNQLSFRETYDRIRSYWTTER